MEHSNVEREPYAARVSPPTRFVLGGPWRLPLPCPLKRHRGTAVCGVVTDQVYVCVFVKVRVGVKLSSDEILDFARGGGAYVGKAGDICVDGDRGGVCGCHIRPKDLLGLAHDEGKGEYELVVVTELEEEGWGAVWVRRRLGVLARRGRSAATSAKARGSARDKPGHILWGQPRRQVWIRVACLLEMHWNIY